MAADDPYIAALAAAGVQHPANDIDRLRVHLAATGQPESALAALVERRKAREPLERILGAAEFYGQDFALDNGVFKPGFETETTAEYGMMELQQKSGPVRILDLGTGTGCILLTLLKHLPHATGLGVDINEETLAVARKNAQACNLSDRAVFQVTDWAEGVEGPFDLVISNPPRLPTAAIPQLVREVSLYDPHHALDGGPRGIEFYARTARDFRRLAAPDGVCVMQVGDIIAADALRTFWKYGFKSASFRRDYKMAVNCIVSYNDPEPFNPLRFLKNLLGV